MKNLINISLLFLFATTFVACNKEIIRPVSEDVQAENCFFYEGDEDSNFNRSQGNNSDEILTGENGITDPDEDEDFDGDKNDNITDPDEDEDFDGDKNDNVVSSDDSIVGDQLIIIAD